MNAITSATPASTKGRRRASLAEDQAARRAAEIAHASPSSLIMAAPLLALGAVSMIASVGTAAITKAMTAAASHGTWTTSGGTGLAAFAVSVTAGTMSWLRATPERQPQAAGRHRGHGLLQRQHPGDLPWRHAERVKQREVACPLSRRKAPLRR